MENGRNSRQEPGIARFDMLQQTDDPSRFVLVEVYRTQEAIPAHKETPHYQTWLKAVDDMFAEPRTRALYTNVSPGDEAW
jgi:quinol monooxygenase YgiN